MQQQLQTLQSSLDGELHYGSLMRHLYATDASVYRELPLAVVIPRHEEDIRKVILFAREHGLSIIPRAAGTSLAGQCVGDGIVVDISKHLNRILEVNAEEGWVRVQPGVVRDELNVFLKGHGLFFGPNTSTANRAMIGGMVGNNSCGTTSIVYGSTRDHVLELKTILSDGSDAFFHALSQEKLQEKLQGDKLENKVYRQLYDALSRPEQQQAIRESYPKASIHRRNTGYAVDIMLDGQPFQLDGEPFNLCKLLSGSEGTLAFTIEIKLHVDPLPKPYEVVVCAHYHSIDESMQAVLVAMSFNPDACELMDKFLMDLTRQNIEQRKNRFFVEGDPAAILMVEFRGDSLEEAMAKAEAMITLMKEEGLGYAFPIVEAPKTKQVWDLRKAGLGIMGNLEGDPKPVACIEDTAVDIQDLPAYIREFTELMAGFKQQAVYYAHAGAGELHLRPILNLKEAEGQQLFHDITEAVARLVKKYDGSLSGEHGDGRVRAEFIPLMIGEQNYELLKEIKHTWDPQNIFNPGKIVDAPPMNSSLRYKAGQETPEFDTVFDFSQTQGILRAAEKCNGSGDCRKLSFAGGTMCPSYRATRDEKDTTRGRANTLREFLTMNVKENPFNHPEIKEAMDLCLSCKGCTAECPSNVDMATLKAEFLYQYYQSNGVPLRSRAFANFGRLNGLASIAPGLSNFFLSNAFFSGLMKRFLNVAPQRSLPLLHSTTLRRWFAKNRAKLMPVTDPAGSAWFFCDEFTNFNDTPIGIKAIELLSRLGYEVKMIDHEESGRAHLSKGLLTAAQRMAQQNVEIFKDIVTADVPLIGVEPSAILGFRDEYPRLVNPEHRPAAKALGQNALMIEEFLAREIEAGRIRAEQFTTEPRHVLLHGHCHQKSLSNVDVSAFVLSLPENYTVEVIPSGCCGMAGSFGYEAEHYEVSMKVGEEVLFPAVRKASKEAIIAAPGTSCRHQIKDGAEREALHPVEVLWEALGS
ncbi:MAG: FAD-binding protein [Lewinellaceae bacterium]|nr:FAD-binding protein [Lewinellaceae bacterium]MCB9286141.1 FAD-binding protein [Lewinellaceae bacterium]